MLEDDDIECTLIERKVLALGCKHPFICHLFCTFQTEVRSMTAIVADDVAVVDVALVVGVDFYGASLL